MGEAILSNWISDNSKLNSASGGASAWGAAGSGGELNLNGAVSGSKKSKKKWSEEND